MPGHVISSSLLWPEYDNLFKGKVGERLINCQILAPLTFRQPFFVHPGTLTKVFFSGLRSDPGLSRTVITHWGQLRNFACELDNG